MMNIEKEKRPESLCSLFSPNNKFYLGKLEEVDSVNSTYEISHYKITVTLKDRSYITFILHIEDKTYDIISYNHRLNIRTAHAFRLTTYNYKTIYEWTVNLINQAKKPIV